MTVKITVSSLPIAQASMVERINAHFTQATLAAMPREQSWLRKREIATEVAAGGEGTFAFASEAADREMTVPDFAALILSKKNPVEIAEEREAARQAALHAVESAASHDELQAISASL